MAGIYGALATSTQVTLWRRRGSLSGRSGTTELTTLSSKRCVVAGLTVILRTSSKLLLLYKAIQQCWYFLIACAFLLNLKLSGIAVKAFVLKSLIIFNYKCFLRLITSRRTNTSLLNMGVKDDAAWPKQPIPRGCWSYTPSILEHNDLFGVLRPEKAFNFDCHSIRHAQMPLLRPEDITEFHTHFPIVCHGSLSAITDLTRLLTPG